MKKQTFQVCFFFAILQTLLKKVRSFDDCLVQNTKNEKNQENP